MQDKKLLQMALGLQSPWKVTEATLDMDNQRLDIHINFSKGGRFSCPQCQQASCSVHDTKKRTWRHLSFFQYETYLHARVPRIDCDQCGVKQVDVPWARSGSGFTLLFEAFVMQLAMQMPIAPIAKLFSVHPDSIWRILTHYIDNALMTADLSEVTRIGIDECSKQKGHQYITTFCDLDRSRVLYVAEGRKKDTVKAFVKYITTHNATPDQIQEVCCDMWPAYISAIKATMPNASIVYDRYHVMALMNRAVDEVRQQELKTRSDVLSKTRYLWLKNPENLKAWQQPIFNSIKELDLKTSRAYHIKMALKRFWDYIYPKTAQRYLKKWYFWATHSRLEPVIKVAKTIKSHWQGVVNFTRIRITNGIVEGINSKIKTALKRAYGFKRFSYYRTVIYLVAGKFDLPTRC